MKKQTLLGMEVYYEDNHQPVPPPKPGQPSDVWVFGDSSEEDDFDERHEDFNVDFVESAGPWGHPVLGPSTSKFTSSDPDEDEEEEEEEEWEDEDEDEDEDEGENEFPEGPYGKLKKKGPKFFNPKTVVPVKGRIYKVRGLNIIARLKEIRPLTKKAGIFEMDQHGIKFYINPSDLKRASREEVENYLED